MLQPNFHIAHTKRFGIIAYGQSGSTLLREPETRATRLVALDVVCPYTAELVRNGFKRRRPAWQITNARPARCLLFACFSSKADLHYGDYECLNWDAIVAGKLRASSYCIRKGLSRKAQLSMYTNKYLSKIPASPLRHAMVSCFDMLRYPPSAISHGTCHTIVSSDVNAVKAASAQSWIPRRFTDSTRFVTALD
eukprot:18408-Heterococcus_DN1.PRE.3